LFVLAVVTLGAIAAVIAACERPPEPSVEAYCRAMADAEHLDEGLASMDPAQLAPQVAALQRASKVAPLEIAPQINTVLDLTKVLHSTIDSARTDQAEAMEQTLRDHADQLAAATAAGRDLENYTRDNCGIELDSTAVPAPRG
jgi:hypothetical protein